MTSLAYLISTAAFGSAVFAALLTLVLLVRMARREALRDTQRVFEQLDLLRAEMLMMHDEFAALQIVPQAAVVEPRPAPEPRVANVVTAATPRGYEVAARLARSGASVDELMSNCGLSRHEAALLLRLHGTAHQQAHQQVQQQSPQRAAETKVSKGNVPVVEEGRNAALLQRKSRLSVVG